MNASARGSRGVDPDSVGSHGCSYWCPTGTAGVGHGSHHTPCDDRLDAPACSRHVHFSRLRPPQRDVAEAGEMRTRGWGQGMFAARRDDTKTVFTCSRRDRGHLEDGISAPPPGGCATARKPRLQGTPVARRCLDLAARCTDPKNCTRTMCMGGDDREPGCWPEAILVLGSLGGAHQSNAVPSTLNAKLARSSSAALSINGSIRAR